MKVIAIVTSAPIDFKLTESIIQSLLGSVARSINVRHANFGRPPHFRMVKPFHLIDESGHCWCYIRPGYIRTNFIDSMLLIELQVIS